MSNVDFIFTHTNRLIEFHKYNKNFVKYLFLKSFALVIDISLIYIFQLVFYIFFKNILEWYLLGMIGAIWMIAYASIAYMICGQTLGLFITKLKVINKIGCPASTLNYFTRAALASIYAMPIIGWALMATSLITSPFWKGITLTDWISRTSVISKNLYINIKNIEEKEVSHYA